MESNQRPRLAITMGDGAGIGPEIIVKALARPEVFELCRPLVVGDVAMMREQFAVLARQRRAQNRQRLTLPPTPSGTTPRSFTCCNPVAPLAGVVPGVLSATAGQGAVDYVMAAVDLAKAGEAAGIVTAPLNKEAIHQAGYAYPGHTELLAEQFGVAINIRLSSPHTGSSSSM